MEIFTLGFSIFLFLLLQASPCAAEEPIMITLVAEVYQAKRAAIEPFLRSPIADVSQFLSALQKMAKGLNGKANFARLPVLTTVSGNRSFVQGGKDVTFEASPLVAADGQTVILTASLHIGKQQARTDGASVKFGGIVHLGLDDGPTKDSVQLVFVRVVKQQAAPVK